MYVLECLIKSDDSGCTFWSGLNLMIFLVYFLECSIKSDDSWCTFWSVILNMMIPGVHFGMV